MEFFFQKYQRREFIPGAKEADSPFAARDFAVAEKERHRAGGNAAIQQYGDKENSIEKNEQTNCA